MIDAIRSEARKLLTVRSTYVLTLLSAALAIFFGFYVLGYRADKTALHDTGFLASQVTGTASTLVIFGAIVAILLMTHEYRYNTIMYSLTASNRRSKVLLAKLLVITLYGLFFTALIAILAAVSAYLGVHAKGNELVPQVLDYGSLIWQILFYGVGMSLAGLLIAALVRSQVAAIAALFLIPGAIEQILSLLLKQNAVYLPFTALGEVVNSTAMGGGNLSPVKGALVFAAYIVVGWIIAFVLLARRDAN